ncbi:lipocalin family protein [Teredinibacter purpureus]|uniref:lipocalin family protein n=1 Tax=Teredinibacter purpureus TaxID=2731756 RepID=UPI0005F81A78|nr:lipocalin family protein [Teredinibacter purpureus]
MKLLKVVVVALLLSSCAGVPEGVVPVSGFELDRYLGKWHEIARLDHRYERGLEQVTATYSMADNGSVVALNRGFSTKKKEWKEAKGKAVFSATSDIGDFNVSFFGPFYGSYVIFELDKENYQYAFVTGNKHTLWLLSRTPYVSEEIKERFLQQVEALGYNTEKLIFTTQK